MSPQDAPKTDSLNDMSIRTKTIDDAYAAIGHRNPAPNLVGKYLTFRLRNESFGFNALIVREIVRLPKIVSMPDVPKHVRGVIDLRGKIIPVLDIRQLFGFTAITDGETTCVVVVQTQSEDGKKSFIGVMVDAVEDVVNIPAEDVEPTPDFGGGLRPESVLGIAKVRGGVKTLLDIEKLAASYRQPETTIHA